MPDPRYTAKGNLRHNFKDIIVIVLCGLLSGIRCFEEIEDFANAKKEWLATFLELPNGIPSHDTMARVLSVLDVVEFERRFGQWAQLVANMLPGTVVAIDGKTMRHSYNKATGQKAAHIVSAFAAECELTIAHMKVDEKENEIVAIPTILEALHLAGCIVTIDAMGCQREIAKQITEVKAADYVFGLKGNQPTLQREVKEYFDAEAENKETVRFTETTEKAHGRIETRKCWVSDDVNWFEDKQKWPNLNSLVRIESTRYCCVTKKTSVEIRHYISSLATPTAQAMLQVIRSHWGIENKAHYIVDVTMGEDACRRRKANFAQVTSLLNRMVLNLFKIPGRNTTSIPRKQAKCAYNDAYRAQVLFSGKTTKIRSSMNA